MTETIIENRLAEYVAEIAAQFATGAATEHSYCPALQRLLADAIPRATIVNEPARIECGAPDILVRENGSARRPVGYVETKDIGDPDLDGNSAHREQFDRYKAELSNIVFTDYLDFHFYEDGEFVAKCRVAEVAGNRVVPAAPEELERFAGLIRHFAEVVPKRIASPSRLAHLMAGKARLLARAVVATLGGPRFVAAADGTKPVPPCRVYHAEVFGEREAKYGFLDAHDLANVDYKELHPQVPHCFFVPKDFALQEEYEKGFSVAELMPVNNSGIQTKRGRVVYQFTQKDIETVVGSFRNEDVESLRKLFYLYTENMGKVEKTPNLNPEIVSKISAAISAGTPTNPTCSTRSTRLNIPRPPKTSSTTSTPSSTLLRIAPATASS